MILDLTQAAQPVDSDRLMQLYTDWCESQGYPVRTDDDKVDGGCLFHDGGNPYSFTLFATGVGYCHSSRCDTMTYLPEVVEAEVKRRIEEERQLPRDQKHRARVARDPVVEISRDKLKSMWQQAGNLWLPVYDDEPKIFTYYLSKHFRFPTAYLTFHQAKAMIERKVWQTHYMWTQYEAGEIGKADLPVIQFGGVFRQRGDDELLVPSGMICVDLDHLSDPHALLEQAQDWQDHVLSFISPSGDGVKVVVRYPEGVTQVNLKVWANARFAAVEGFDERAVNTERLTFVVSRWPQTRQ